MIREHTLVMSEHLGRPIRKGELVHHKNENKHDNRLENLELLERGEHLRRHRPKAEMVELTCPVCNVKFAQEARIVRSRLKNGVKRFFCSRRCIGLGQGVGSSPTG